MNIHGYEIDPPTEDEALYAVADLVLQFAYKTKFRNRDAVCDAGLSTLENAFWVLERAGCKINSNGTIQTKNILKFMKEHEKGTSESG